ncbi:MAG: peptidoglycan DD-metalloendopeptidase family protein [Methylophilaceae bacterium]|jgi:septal ring factor EnvC (AmiA/AmiB activator)
MLKHTNRFLVAFTLLALTLSSSFSFAANKAEKPKEKLNNIHDRIESLTKELGKTKEAHADASDALKESEKAISETNRKLFELKQRQQQQSESLQALQTQKASLEKTIEGQKSQLSKQIYEQYLHGQQNYLQVILQEQDPSELTRQLQYFSYIARARQAQIMNMQSNLGRVTKLNEETANALKEVVNLKSKQEMERKNLESQKQAHSKVLEKLSSQINAQRNEIEKLKRDEKSLSQLVDRLARASQPKPQKSSPTNKPSDSSRETATSKTETEPHTQLPLATNESLPNNAFDGSSFESLKGKLNLPVRGEVTNKFGNSRQDTGLTWKGLFIKSNEGNEVKSIANGRVVFADWMRGFGNLIIVDHGGGYMSLYGNNQSLLRKIGDTIKGGDTIASVGNSGGNETSGLYYELRSHSKPFDPMSWSVLR